MSTYDFVVVGGGSAGAVVAARLSEDPAVQVCLLEAGQAPPAAEMMPAACASLQGSEVDWQFTADAGRCGQGLETPGVMFQPRGKMLGGCSGINYMAYVRGHPGDFDKWARDGAAGWSYNEVLPYFMKSEGIVRPGTTNSAFVLDESAHSSKGPLGVSLRQPVLGAASFFVEACQADGLPVIDYNGRCRGGPNGGVSLWQTTTKDGKRSSTYHAFLVPALARPNLKILTGVQATRILLDGKRAAGVEYRSADGTHSVGAGREVVLAAGAFGSPQLLLSSGIGPRKELEALGMECMLENAHVGKHLKDHFQVPLFFHAPGAGVQMQDLAVSLGPDTLRQAGILPADQNEDAALPAELRAVKHEAERRLKEWSEEGKGLAASSLYEAGCFYSTGLGDHHTHDAQLGFFACGYNAEIWQRCLKVDMGKFFGSEAEAERALAADAESVLFLANPVQPHSEGEVLLSSSDPVAAPLIKANYFADPHDMKVTIACLRRCLRIAKNWPGLQLRMPAVITEKYGVTSGDDLSDEVLEDLALHFAWTVYHATSTCRIGDVVDSQLRVMGLQGLRVADASIMPNVISGNTNAPCIMIGEKAAEMIARDHGVALNEFVGIPQSRL
eukprot:TRINITY_DN24798_c0_g1_i1.p1 TRINITY_DN24798_c0_g1~~TRINITY_DN24798_c0_g1_i1.p1  ORF type:complete len:614 (+),score=126.79 TRINITY_DN24798_c0_g1_i1:75-1916(+)